MQRVDVIIVVDMQVGLLSGAPKHDLCALLGRINELASMVRRRSGKVIWIRHSGKPGEPFEPQTTGWALLPELIRDEADIIVEKTLNDAFAATPLQQTLERLAADRVLVTGWATDFCVDATVRSAIARDHHVVVVADGHTLSDRPHLSATAIIQHHNWVWSHLISNRSVRVATAAELLAGAAPRT
jgi:nicotinamidase-related amidase